MKVLFEKSRTSIIMASRQQICNSLVEDIANLNVKSESLEMECEDPGLDLGSGLTDYVIKVIPKGTLCQITSNKISLVIRDLKTNQRVSDLIKLQSFDLFAIYELATRTYWVTKINKLKSYNYKHTSAQVARHLQTATFPHGMVYQGENFSIKFMPEVSYSPESFRAVYSQSYLTCKYIDVVPRVDQSLDKFRVYSQEYYLKKSLRFFLKVCNGALSTSDCICVPLQTPNDLEEGDIYAVKFKYKDLDKLEQLLKVMARSSNKMPVDIGLEEEFQVEPSSIKKVCQNQIKLASRKIMDWKGLMNRIDFEIHRTEFKTFDVNNEH